MFCGKCGKPIDEGNKFCSYCGTPVDAQAEKNTIYLNTQGVKPAKKKLGAGKIALIALAVLVLVGGILLALNFDTVRSWFTSDTGSLGGDYSGSSGEGSGSQQVEDLSQGLGEIYGSIINPQTNISGVKGTIKLRVGDTLKTLLTQLSGVNMQWVDGIGLQVQGGGQGDMYQMQLTLQMSSANVVGVDVIVGKDKIWVGVPELSASYLELDMSMLLDQAGMDMSSLMGALQGSTVKLPSQEKFTQFVSKYLSIIAQNISNATSETAVLAIDGFSNISETVTKQTFVVNYESLEKMLTAVAAELEKDTAAKQIFDELEAYISAQANRIPELDGQMQVEDLYENLLMALKSLIPMVQQQKEQDATWNVQLVSYLNSHNETIGLDVVNVDGQTLLSYARVTSGNQFATKLSAGSLVFAGNGTISGNKENGSYYVELNGMQVVKLQTAGFALTKDGFTGTVRITPTDALLKQILAVNTQGAQYTLELKCASAGAEKQMDINILVNDSLMAGITVSAQTLQSYTVKKPSFTVAGTDEEAVQNWVMGMNIQGVLTKLQSVGVPVEELLGLVMGSVPSQSVSPF